jgi:hypothetical protein
MVPAVDEIAHRRLAPDHAVADAQFLHQLEGRPVGLADEMVEALDRQAGEVEMGRHAARHAVGFEDRDFVTGLERMVGRGQSHGARTDDGDAGHPQNSRTTLE